MLSQQDKTILRDLAKSYLDICHDPEQDKRRDTWRRLHSLQRVKPPINVMQFAWHERPESKHNEVEDPFFQKYETQLRWMNARFSLGDDAVAEPWLTSVTHFASTGWGPETPRHYSGDEGGSFIVDHPLKELDDIKLLRTPKHEINEPATQEEYERLNDALGDVITINRDRAPFYRNFYADLSTDLGYLRGIEETMIDMFENPQWLHRVLEFMSNGVLKVQDEAEAAGDWNLSAHNNQCMPYAQELEDPQPNVNGVERKRLWTFMAAQEFTGVSPAMHEEFLLRHQLPILSKFALVHYGCCEDLTLKIDMLRKIPNLRRIGVSAAADVGRCAEQIGTDYVLSYRPSPADMLSYDFQPGRIRATLRRDLEACKECLVEITMKDVETVQHDPERVKNWTTIAHEVVEEFFG